jgi:hypothetical protein
MGLRRKRLEEISAPCKRTKTAGQGLLPFILRFTSCDMCDLRVVNLESPSTELTEDSTHEFVEVRDVVPDQSYTKVVKGKGKAAGEINTSDANEHLPASEKSGEDCGCCFSAYPSVSFSDAEHPALTSLSFFRTRWLNAGTVICFVQIVWKNTWPQNWEIKIQIFHVWP